MQLRTAKTAMRAASVTLILAFSPFSCKPPRTSVLDEGKNMGTPKPPVVTQAPEKDARTPKERLDAGDTSIVPVVKPKPEFDLPKKNAKPVGRIQ